jgi:hypothetical protein
VAEERVAITTGCGCRKSHPVRLTPNPPGHRVGTIFKKGLVVPASCRTPISRSRRTVPTGIPSPLSGDGGLALTATPDGTLADHESFVIGCER